MRAFFANGVEMMYVPWAVEGLPTLLHLSLFLFFGGLVIFLIDIDQEVFISVVWWIGLFSIVYGMITLLPIIRHDSPYNSPLSTPAWFLYASVHHLTFKVLAFITPGGVWYDQNRWRREDLRDRYRGWMLGGVEKAAEETASERSSEIDVQILDWMISVLDDDDSRDDDSLKSFFEAIPGFFNSKLVEYLQKDFHVELLLKLEDSLDGFLDRTWSSKSINDSEKLRRLDISMNAMDLMRHSGVSFILSDIRLNRWNEVPHTVEMGHILARWCTDADQNVVRHVQVIVAKILVSHSVRERNDSWVMLAARVFGLPERDLPGNIALGGDSVLLAILIRVTHQYCWPRLFHSDSFNYLVLRTISKLDIHNTLPRLQHDFCTLWNEIVRETRKQGYHPFLVDILYGIRHIYIDLHQGTGAAPTAFSASTPVYDEILYKPSSYPSCNLTSHRPHSAAQIHVPNIHLPPPSNSPDHALSPSSADASSTVPQQSKQTNIISGLPAPSNPTSTSEIGATSQSPITTPPTNSSSCPTGASPTAVATTALQDITSAATLSHPQGESKQQSSGIVAPSAEPGTSQILFTTSQAPRPHVPTPVLTSIPTSLPNIPPESYDASVAAVFNHSHFSSPSISSSTAVSRPTRCATLPRLGPRGLVNSRNICFANAVLHLLVNSPPFWNLFRELGDLKGQCGEEVPSSETAGGPTPLVDATLRFFKEFIVEESPPTQRRSQSATGGESRADEEKNDDNVVGSFEPTYMYDAMKEKRQLKPLLVSPRAHLAASCS